MKISEKKGKIPTRNGALNDRRRRRPLRHRGRCLFACSSFGDQGRTEKFLKYQMKKEEREICFSENSKRSNSFSFSPIRLL